MAKQLEDSPIQLSITDQGEIDGMELGALGRALDWDNSLRLASLFVAATFGAQVAYVYAGEPSNLSFWQAFLASLNVPLDVITLGITDILGFHLGKPNESALIPRLVTKICELNYALLILSTAISFRRWHRLRPVIDAMPEHPNYDETLALIDTVCRHPSNPGKEFFDEVIFLTLVEYYTKGQFALVEELARQFPQINVTDDLRQMFVDPATRRPLIQPKPQEPSSEASVSAANVADDKPEQRRRDYTDGTFNRVMNSTKSREPGERSHALSELVKLREHDPDAFRRRMIEMADDESAIIRREVPGALHGHLDQPEVREVLSRLSRDPSPPVRLFAILELRPSKHISAKQIDALHAMLILEHKDAAEHVESLLRQLEHEKRE